jgi:hypothetical protein
MSYFLSGAGLFRPKIIYYLRCTQEQRDRHPLYFIVLTIYISTKTEKKKRDHDALIGHHYHPQFL